LNYLAHLFLSGDDSQVQVGNFIGDFVKGSQLNDYPERIRQGIRLHREIDSFTDSHKVVRETVAFLRPAFGRYSAIVADMYFDYFLAMDFQIYSPEKSLRRFSFRFYFSVLTQYRHLPERVKGFIFHFVFTNRLTAYATMEGLNDSLEIMARHKVKALEPERISAFLLENHDNLRKRFHLFFPDLIEFVKTKIV
jgi:acyl carrier protein phosphodiesterase